MDGQTATATQAKLRRRTNVTDPAASIAASGEQREPAVAASALQREHAAASTAPGLFIGSTFERVRAGSFSFLADNEFIVSGYRHGMSFREAIQSLFQIHNETGNVFSHLCGALVFLALFIHVVTGGLQADVKFVVEHGRDFARLAHEEVLALRQYAGHALPFDSGACPPEGNLADVHGSSSGAGKCTQHGLDPAAELKAAFDGLRETLASAASSVRHAGAGAAAAAEGAVSGATEAVHGAVSEAVSEAADLAHDAWDSLTGTFSDSIDSLSDSADSVRNKLSSLSPTWPTAGSLHVHVPLEVSAAGTSVMATATRLFDELQHHAKAAAVEAESVMQDLRRRAGSTSTASHGKGNGSTDGSADNSTASDSNSGQAQATERLHALLRPLVERAHELARLLGEAQPTVPSGRGGPADDSGSSVAPDSASTRDQAGTSPGLAQLKSSVQLALAGVASGVTRAWQVLDSLGPTIDGPAGGQQSSSAGPGPGQHSKGASVVPLAVFALSALICLSCSAAFHLLHVMNRWVYELLARADYTGIAILIFGSMWPPVMYGFPCQPRLWPAYLGLTGAASLATVVLGMLEVFRTPEWRPVRAGAFVLAGLSGLFPLAHWSIFTDALSHPEGRSAFFHLAGMGAQYLIGAAIYALRVPERWFPGKFDFFPSHFIFHMLVFGAAMTHWVGSVTLYRWADRQVCSP